MRNSKHNGHGARGWARLLAVLAALQMALAMPAAAGRNIARSARQHAAWSVGLALVCGIVGLTLSYYLDTSAGASIVLVSALCYDVSLAIRSFRK